MNESSILQGLDAQQKTAVCVENNAVISAGAGSGKTRVLATRFIYLIIEKKYTVDQILTLTFTKKAANEMYDRIYKALAKQAKTGNLEAQEAITNFHHARIMTLDAYCSSIAKQAAYTYGIQPDFSVDVDTLKELTIQLALQFIIDNRNQPGIQILLANNSVNKLASDFFADLFFRHTTICAPHDFNYYFSVQKESLKAEWKATLLKMYQEIVGLETLCTTSDEDFVQNIVRFYPKTGIPQMTTEDVFMPEKQPEILTILTFYSAFEKIALSRKRGELFIEINACLKNIRLLYPTLVSMANFIFHHDALENLVPLLHEFQTKLIVLKRTLGLLTFADVAQLAFDTLKNNNTVRQNEKRSIKKIMIDEFQDNNRLQKDLLFFLAENLERTEKSVPSVKELRPDVLFFVGDEKQSIYRFRGADVSVFRSLKTELDIQDSISLTTNYRSDPSLIASFNYFFGGFVSEITNQHTLCELQGFPSIFCKRNQFSKDTFPAYEAEYFGVQAFDAVELQKEKTEDVQEHTSHDCLHISFFSDEEHEKQEDDDMVSVYEIEAEFVADEIDTLHHSQNVAYNDIAILFRTLSNQSVFESCLREKNIPYKTDQLTGFFADAPVNDLYALLRLVVYPHDLHTYISVLTGPFVKMSIKCASVCIIPIVTAEITSDEQYLLNPFVPFDKNTEALLDADNQCRYQNGRILYNELLACAKEKSNAELISYLWYEKGYSYETQWKQSVQSFAELYDYLFELARRHDEQNKPLSVFIDSIAKMIEKSSRLEDMDIPIEQKDGVQLMSIHKSKGLEFHTVFLVSVQKKSQSGHYNQPAYFSETVGLVPNLPAHILIPDNKAASNYFYGLEKLEEEKRACAELRRLLYVGMTRAEHTLYICGTIKPKKEKDSTEVICTIDEKIASLYEEKKTKLKDDQIVLEKNFLDFLLSIIARTDEFRAKEQKFFSLREIVDSISDDRFFEESYPERKEAFNKMFAHIESLPPFPIKKPQRKSFAVTDLVTIDQVSQKQSVPVANDSFTDLDTIIRKLGTAFTAADFGILVHICLEEAVNNEGVLPDFNTFSLQTAQKLDRIRRKLAHSTTDTAVEHILLYAKKLTENFLLSDLGKDVLHATWKKTEFAFKLLEKEIIPRALKVDHASLILNGTIDLLYQNDGKVIIIDFKTDKQEDPYTHKLQLALYQKACTVIFQKEVSTIVFYLRSGNYYIL